MWIDNKKEIIGWGKNYCIIVIVFFTIFKRIKQQFSDDDIIKSDTITRSKREMFNITVAILTHNFGT